MYRTSHFLRRGILNYLSIAVIRRIWLNFLGYILKKIYLLENRPAKWLFQKGVLQYITQREYINKYGLSESAKDIMDKKRQAIEYYVKYIIEDRDVYLYLADNIMIDIEHKDDVDFGFEKAALSKALNIPIDNNVTIGEWRGYFKLVVSLYNNDKS